MLHKLLFALVLASLTLRGGGCIRDRTRPQVLARIILVCVLQGQRRFIADALSYGVVQKSKGSPYH